MNKIKKVLLTGATGMVGKNITDLKPNQFILYSPNRAQLDLLNFLNVKEYLEKIKPDIIALGYDQKINRKELKIKLKKYNLNPKIIWLKPYQPQKYKSSKINKQLNSLNKKLKS